MTPPSPVPAALPPCRVCGAANVRFLCQTHNEHSRTHTLDNYRCDACGSVFIGNVLTGDELGQAYATMDSGQYYREIAEENTSKMMHSARDLERMAGKTSHILDVGAGNGLFTMTLHKAGFTRLSAHEISGADLSLIKEIAQGVYEDFDYSTLPERGFDAVTLLDVLEHVLSPQYLVDTCGRVLSKGGLLYIHTPVVTKLDRLMHAALKLPLVGKIGRIWQRGRTSVFHLENYTPRSLQLILERAGFGDIHVEVTNELSWPVTRYIRIYLLERLRLPGFLAPLLLPIFYPLLATNFFNANKGVVSARKS